MYLLLYRMNRSSAAHARPFTSLALSLQRFSAMCTNITDSPDPVPLPFYAFLSFSATFLFGGFVIGFSNSPV